MGRTLLECEQAYRIDPDGREGVPAPDGVADVFGGLIPSGDLSATIFQRKLTRRQFLMTAGIATVAVGASVLPGCGPLTDSLSDIPRAELDRYLRFSDGLSELESKGLVTYEYFGPLKSHRVVRVEARSLLPTDGQDLRSLSLDARIDEYEEALKRYEYAMVFQRFNPSTNTYETIKVPGSMGHLEAMQAIVRPENMRTDLIDTEKQLGMHFLTQAAVSPEVSDEVINTIVNYYVDPVKAPEVRRMVALARAENYTLPPAIKEETLQDIFNALQANAVIDIDPNRSEIRKLSYLSQLTDAVFVPKIDIVLDDVDGYDLRTKDYREYAEKYAENEFHTIPVKPTVYFARVKAGALDFEQQSDGTKFVLIYEMPDGERRKIDFPQDKNVLAPLESWTGNDAEARVVTKEKLGLSDEEILECYRMDPKAMKWYVIPTKVKLTDDLKQRLVPGLSYFSNSLSPALHGQELVIPMGDNFTDWLIRSKFKEGFIVNNNWISEVTDLVNARLTEAGEVSQLSKVGLLTPLKVVDKISKGLRTVFGSVITHGAWLPEHPELQAYIADMAYQVAQDPKMLEKFENVVFANCIREMPMFQLSYEKYAEFRLAMSEHAATTFENISGTPVEPLENHTYVDRVMYSDGSPATIMPGDMLIITEVFMAPDGKEYVVLNGSREISELATKETGSMIVVPMDYARNGIIPNDPDNTILEFLVKTAKVFAVAGTAFYWLTNPVAAGAVVTGSGLAVQKYTRDRAVEWMSILASFGSDLLSVGYKILK